MHATDPLLLIANYTRDSNGNRSIKRVKIRSPRRKLRKAWSGFRATYQNLLEETKKKKISAKSVSFRSIMHAIFKTVFGPAFVSARYQFPHSSIEPRSVLHPNFYCVALSFQATPNPPCSSTVQKNSVSGYDLCGIYAFLASRGSYPL